jgi:hypothetical protein
VYEQLRTPVHSATTIRLGHPPFTERNDGDTCR